MMTTEQLLAMKKEKRKQSKQKNPASLHGLFCKSVSLKSEWKDSYPVREVYDDKYNFFCLFVPALSVAVMADKMTSKNTSVW